MPVTTTWFIENRVILVTTFDEVTPYDVFGVTYEINFLLEDHPDPVYLLVDDRLMTRQPGLSSIRTAEKNGSQFIAILNVGLRNPIQRFVAQTITGMFGAKLLFFSDMDNALDYLYREAPDLRKYAREARLSV